MGMGEKIGYAFMVAGIGIGVVILVLLVLVGFLYLFRWVFGLIDKAELSRKAALAAAAVGNQADDEEEIAAVMAAVQCVLEAERAENADELPELDFVVKVLRN